MNQRHQRFLLKTWMVSWSLQNNVIKMYPKRIHINCLVRVMHFLGQTTVITKIQIYVLILYAMLVWFNLHVININDLCNLEVHLEYNRAARILAYIVFRRGSILRDGCETSGSQGKDTSGEALLYMLRTWPVRAGGGGDHCLDILSAKASFAKYSLVTYVHFYKLSAREIV